MAIIAVESGRRVPEARQVVVGSGCTVSEVVCTAGPDDTPFEEQHSNPSIAVVVSGTFQYRCRAGSELIIPGALLLGNAGDHFTCSHEHGTGDRCVAFSYDAGLFERISHEAGAAPARFGVPRLPPGRQLAALIVDCLALLSGVPAIDSDELGIRAAAAAVRLAHGSPGTSVHVETSAIARVTRVVRMIDAEPDLPHRLFDLAQLARLSPYHFLRTFEAVTGTTPHQYVLRHRLRRAALTAEARADKGPGDSSGLRLRRYIQFQPFVQIRIWREPRVYRGSGTEDNRPMRDRNLHSVPAKRTHDRNPTATRSPFQF